MLSPEFNSERLYKLITNHLDNKLDGEELLELNQWVEADKFNKDFLDRVINEKWLLGEVEKWGEMDPAAGYEKWLLIERRRRSFKIRRTFAWVAAAAILLTVIVSVWLEAKVHNRIISSPPTVQTIQPGRNVAILTLSEGQKVVLDSNTIGNLPNQGSVQLLKTTNGSLSYLASSDQKSKTVLYNTLTTSRSGQYQLLLPDGSRVWLNNVSSLKYPVSFVGNERMVELTGEAYFEVAKNVRQPFVVKVGDEKIEVLGTDFNISAYPEEGTAQTTLLSGSVKVEAHGSSILLKPNQQVQYDSGKLKLVDHVASEEIVSWKNGFFYFGRASFGAIMRQISRWYDVDVVYEGKVPNIEFGGKIDRSLSLNELLQFLDQNQIHFRLEGRKLIVSPS